MKLGAFLNAPGHHVAAWRHPCSRPDKALDFQYYLEMARVAERGKFDMIFFSDGVGVRTHYRDPEELSRQGRVVHFEPLTLLSALAVTTQHIGLAATASTTYNEPFHVARKFASLDYLSHGRAAWNIVTSVTDAEALNFNLSSQPDHETRYRRAREFTKVVAGLWDSWEDGAFVYERHSGRSFDATKMRILGHVGEFFSVRGPLNVARSPQGYPVLIQAGSSEDGQDFAAEWAEVVFTAQPGFDQARSFYSSMREQIALHGRQPDHVKILPGVFVVVGHTLAEAEDKYEKLQELIDPVVGLSLLTSQLGDIDLTSFALDAPLPEIPETEGSTSRQKMILEKARREHLTLRQLIQSIAGGRGHYKMLGTPQSIADEMEAWFAGAACDGFNLLPPCLPDSLTEFVNLVIPELQRRGLFRTEYSGSTLREHLEIPRPNFRAKS